jgi:putative transposase
LGTLPTFIEPGSAWENEYFESFNLKDEDELLNCDIFDAMQEAKVLIERWRPYYNIIRPHSTIDYRPPVVDIDLKMA